MGHHRKKIQTKKKKQRAGAYVGKGTYGCTFRPALRCEGEEERYPGFSKIMERFDAEEELKQKTLLYPIDPDQQYFIYPERACVPAPPVATNQLDMCPHDFGDRDLTRILLQKDGGSDLTKLKLEPSDFLGFFRSLRGLAEGLQKIHAVGIFHNDIKPPNIVSLKQPDGSFLTRFIDLGLMVSANTFDREAYPEGKFPGYELFQQNYIYWSFEVRLVNPIILTRALAPDNVFINKQLKNYYSVFSGISVDAPIKELIYKPLTVEHVHEMAKKYNSLTRQNRYFNIFSGSDIHALGLTFAQVYLQFTGHRDRGTTEPQIVIENERDKVWQPVSGELIGYSSEAAKWHRTVERFISIPFYTLVRRMIASNPLSRATAGDVITAYDAILPQMEKYFTPEAIRSFVHPFKTEMIHPPTPRPFPLSPLQEEPNVRPIPTPRPPVLSPFIEERIAPNSNWRLVSRKNTRKQRTKNNRRENYTL